MSAPRLGIVLSSFERPRGLQAAIESLQAQTFTDWVCVLSDDYSSDPEVFNLIMKTIADDERFVFIFGRPRFTPEQKLKRCSFSVHINAALDYFRDLGVEYASYLLDDVTYYPERCQKHVEFLDRRRDVLLVWGEQWLEEYREDGSLKRERKQVPNARDNYADITMPVIRDRMSRQNIINHCSATHRITDHRWPEEASAWQQIDRFFWIKLLNSGEGRFIHLPILGELMKSTPFDIGPAMVHRKKNIAEIARERAERGE